MNIKKYVDFGIDFCFMITEEWGEGQEFIPILDGKVNGTTFF